MGERGVLVTGASSGIGAAVVGELVKKGFAVFGTTRRPEDDPAVTRLGALPVRLDVTDARGVAALPAELETKLAGRPLAGLVNNAGIARVGPLELVPLDEVRRVFDVNVFGVLAVTQACLPLLRAARGRVVNISSISGLDALPFMGPYAASKFALEGLSDSLRRELLPHGVDVIVIEPGSYQSKIWGKQEALDWSAYRDSLYGRRLERFLELALESARRAPPPDAVARAVARALTARRPPARMLVTEQALVTRLMFWAPTRWMDRMIVKVLSRAR